MGMGQNIYSKLTLCCDSRTSCLSGRASTFWRRVSYSYSSLWAFLYSDCRAVLLAVISSILPRSRWVAGSGTASRRFNSLAAASNRMISPLMPPEEFLLVSGLAVLVIQGEELAVGVSVLHGEGQPLHFLLCCPEIRFHPGDGGCRTIATPSQFLITGNSMFGQEVQRFRGSL